MVIISTTKIFDRFLSMAAYEAKLRMDQRKHQGEAQVAEWTPVV